MTEKAIVRFRGENGFLSNMYAAAFEWDGRTYQNAEAAFQSAKSLNAEERAAFGGLSGAVAKRQGKKVLLRRDWEKVKVGIMEEVVRAKFMQNPDLAKKLAETGDAQLMEGNNWHDTFWGVDAASLEGENHLGEILMKIRAELQQGDFLETAERMNKEKEDLKRREKEQAEEERRQLAARLEVLPAYDFVGMEVNTRAFGRGRILQQEGNYLTVLVRGQEKKFALPDCFIQGYLIPDDPSVTETLKEEKELRMRLKQLGNA